MANSISNGDKKLKAARATGARRAETRKATIVTAESCTAGTIAALLAQAEGASDILHGGSTTYTKGAEDQSVTYWSACSKNKARSTRMS